MISHNMELNHITLTTEILRSEGKPTCLNCENKLKSILWTLNRDRLSASTTVNQIQAVYMLVSSEPASEPFSEPASGRQRSYMLFSSGRETNMAFMATLWKDHSEEEVWPLTLTLTPQW